MLLVRRRLAAIALASAVLGLAGSPVFADDDPPAAKPDEGAKKDEGAKGDTELPPEMQELNRILRHEPQSEFFVEIPTRYGKLVLDVLEAEAALGRVEMTPEMEADAEAAWKAGRDLFKPGAHEASEKAMVEIVRKYPYWGKGHGALFELYGYLRDGEKAGYHLRQLIAIQPRYDNLVSLGEHLGKMGKYDDSRTLLEHLVAERAKAPDDLQARRATGILLITLTKLKDGAAMIEVADAAIVDLGESPDLVYQAALGRILEERFAEAEKLVDGQLARLKADSPFVPRFQNMKRVIAQQKK